MAAPALGSSSSNGAGGGVKAVSASSSPSSSGFRAACSTACSPELDFSSGATIPELNRFILEFNKHDQREYDDQRALEIHTAKDFIFSMLGMVQKLDQKLPVANEYLLLSGGVRDGVVDMDLEELGVYNRGSDYDMAFTLLVPALKLHDRNQPVTLDMRHSALGHSWLSLRLFDEGTIARWRDCCTMADHLNGTTNYFFSPTLVADWFQEAVALVLAEVQRKPQRGTPRVERVERHSTLLSMILGVGSSRMLYDIVPVVSFKGWPAVAQSWLMENHFWDGKITEEEVISGFYLLPACSASGRRENEWRLSFARSEVQLKKCISPGLMQAFQACKSILVKLLGQPSSVSPYHLRSIMLWACDRLPASYLAQEDFAAHFLLGLIDDLQHCLVNKTCPNYFIPQCNMLEHLCDETAMFHARKLALVRSDPAEYLRSTIEQAKAANRLTQEMQRRGSSSGLPSPQSDPSSADHQQPDDRLAKKLQQLVTENPGKSISVFINPDDVSRPHFRIDDKFF
ncbi:nucleotidyltransferase MB21D2-like [Hoplias malabaricus]|uniref:nucleotidyltransferase MB21D2-like n=1 Tax=Hoplias malabaricus TaxID=27720 RepID=UPI0034630C58